MSAEQELLSALAATARALTANEAKTASAAMDQAVRACEEARAAAILLEPSALAEAQRLFHSCVTTAAEVRARLHGELTRIGLGRRAVRAYRVKR